MEEGGEVVMERTGVRIWQSELPNWPCLQVLGCSPDSFFFLMAGDAGKHPLRTHRKEAKYTFIVKSERVVVHWTEE